MKPAAEDIEALLRQAFDVAVQAALPHGRIGELWGKEMWPWLKSNSPNLKKLWVFGVGKGAISMGQALEAAVGQDLPMEGLLITRKGAKGVLKHLKVMHASHPVPEEDSQRAAKALLKKLAEVPATDAAVLLVSGGGSALLSHPVKDIPFVDLQNVTRSLLACGAPIDEFNIVRKHVTSTLGGQCALACRAPMMQLLISDVPGDDPSSIASGPFCPDESTFADAQAVLKRWQVQVPHSVSRYLERGAKGEVAETPNTSALAFRKIRTEMLASNRISLDAVEQFLSGLGYKVLSLGDGLEGESRVVAKVQASAVKQIIARASNWPRGKVALISGGECSVTLSEQQMRQAKGGRNSEFLLALFHELRMLDSKVQVAALAADTDGIDGVGGHAGALMLPGDAALARERNLVALKFLDTHCSFDFFEKMGRLLMTGPTHTNVNDLRVILVE